MNPTTWGKNAEVFNMIVHTGESKCSEVRKGFKERRQFLADNNGTKIATLSFRHLDNSTNFVTIGDSIGRQTEIYRLVTGWNLLQIRHAAISVPVNTAE